MRRESCAIAAALALVAIAVPEAQASSFTLRARGSGSGPGTVSAIGDFKPTRDASLRAATVAFGAPSSRRVDGSSCTVGWGGIGLRIVFANFGIGGACEQGSAQTASAFGRAWRTPKGLKIGSRASTVRRYPGAVRKGRTYRLVGGQSIGGGGRYPVLAAKTDGSRVRSFKLFIGAAGE